MVDFFTRRTIHNNLSACRRQQHKDPIPPARRETQVLKDLKKKRSGHRIKDVHDINLEKT
jgi:hypothetical protein